MPSLHAAHNAADSLNLPRILPVLLGGRSTHCSLELELSCLETEGASKHYVGCLLAFNLHFDDGKQPSEVELH